MYRFIVRSCGTTAAGCAVFYVMTLIGTAVDPEGIRMPRQLGTILLTVTIVGALVAVHGWQVQAAARRSAERIAATVTHSVAGTLEQLLYRVAERTAGAAHDQLVAAIREVAAGVRADLSNSLGEQVETWLDRAHTRGMIDEAAGRSNGTVSSISRRES